MCLRGKRHRRYRQIQSASPVPPRRSAAGAGRVAMPAHPGVYRREKERIGGQWIPNGERWPVSRMRLTTAHYAIALVRRRSARTPQPMGHIRIHPEKMARSVDRNNARCRRCKARRPPEQSEPPDWASKFPSLSNCTGALLPLLAHILSGILNAFLASGELSIGNVPKSPAYMRKQGQEKPFSSGETD